MAHGVFYLLLVIFASSNIECQLFGNIFQNRYQTMRTITRYVASNEYTTSKPIIYRQRNNNGYENERTAEENNRKKDELLIITAKPRKLNKSRTSRRSEYQEIGSNFNGRVNNYNRNHQKRREIVKTKRYNNNRFVYPNNNDNNNYQTTHRPYNFYDITTKSSYNNYEITKPNYFTTNNPFDERPPNTNRPATKRPGYITDPRPTKPGTIMFPKDLDVSPDKVQGISEDDMSEAEKRNYIDLAERMCNKYKSMTTKKHEGIPLLISPDPVIVTDSCAALTIPLVVGGNEVEIKDFPHMALLGWTKIYEAGYSWKCGGSLISERFVLTAAHCAYDERDSTVVSGPPRVVQLGSSNPDGPEALVVRVASYIRHPKYKRPATYYDLALLKLASDVKFSERIKPACLGMSPPVGEPVIATGWGQTEFSGQSLKLRSVSLPIWSNEECLQVLGTTRRYPNGPSKESQICAGDRRGGKDTCDGDSGGPAQIQDGCLWRVVAVTSNGRACGVAGTPGIYAIAQRAFIAANVFQDQNQLNNHNNDASNTYFSSNHERRREDNLGPIYNVGIDEQNQYNGNGNKKTNNNDASNTYFSSNHERRREDNLGPIYNVGIDEQNQYNGNGNKKTNNNDASNTYFSSNHERRREDNLGPIYNVGIDEQNQYNGNGNKKTNNNDASNTYFSSNHERRREDNLGSIYNVGIDEQNQYNGNGNNRERNNQDNNVNSYNNNNSPLNYRRNSVISYPDRDYPDFRRVQYNN